MKRSEMVKYMAQVIMTPRMDYTERDPKEYWEMVASELLLAMEDLGMLPPEVKALGSDLEGVNAWEPEDE
jgi:hypothetical protein